MRLIDADALMELLTTAIRNMGGVAKFLDAEDDPEIKMEIKAYTDIANGVKDMPTIYPETEEEAYERGYTAGQMAQRKTGKWIEDNTRMSGPYYVCDQCGSEYKTPDNFCGNCGAKMEEGDHS